MSNTRLSMGTLVMVVGMGRECALLVSALARSLSC